MPKVLCTSENASDEISGVKFEKTEDGMLSEEISDETAAYFCQINGYALKDDGAAAAQAAADADAAAKAQAEADAKVKADAAAKAAAEAAADQAARDASAEAGKAAAEAAELVTLTARAVELGIEVKSTWKAARLTAEIKRAEESKAAAEAAGQ